MKLARINFELRPLHARIDLSMHLDRFKINYNDVQQQPETQQELSLFRCKMDNNNY